MISVTALLIPALVSAVLVFIASSIIHMLTPWHAGDFQRLPNEDGVLSALRPFNIAPGTYVAPRPSSMKDMGSPEFQAKARLGPNVTLQVRPAAGTGIGRQLGLWFVFSFVVALFAGYITSKALLPAADYKVVFKFVAAITFGTYVGGLWQQSIWYGGWEVTLKSTVDGLLYALLTAGTFGWLWPR